MAHNMTAAARPKQTRQEEWQASSCGYSYNGMYHSHKFKFLFLLVLVFHPIQCFLSVPPVSTKYTSSWIVPGCHSPSKGPTTTPRYAYDSDSSTWDLPSPLQSSEEEKASKRIKGKRATKAAEQDRDAATAAVKKIGESTKRKSKTKKKVDSTFQEPLYWSVESDPFVLEKDLRSLPSNNVNANITNAPLNNDETTRDLVVQCKKIRFTVRGKPVPLRRHRTSRGYMYNPSAQAQAAFREVAQQRIMISSLEENIVSFPGSYVCSDEQEPLFPEDQFLAMTLLFRLRRPRNHFVASKPGPGRLRPTAPKYLAPTRTDVDNLAKFVLDSLNEVLYVDDRQVISIHAIKVFDTEGDCLGATEVCIESIKEDEVDDYLKHHGM